MRSLAMAGLWLTAWFSLSAGAGELTSAASQSKELLQVKVHQLVADPSSLQPVVILADLLGERALPIWIGHFEANAINAEMQGLKHLRPLTHDLAERIIQKMNAKIQRVIITHRQENTYYATIVIEKEGSLIEIDARPSDSIVMALKFKAPIFVSTTLFREMAMPLGEPKGIEERYGLTIQELTPSLAQSFSYGSTRGVLVSDVRKGSRAEKDGIQRGDIFVELGGEVVENVPSLKEALQKSKTPLPARIFRNANFLSIHLHLK